MRPQKVGDTDLLKGMMAVFRSKGYDGASLNELASSSGLQKASLYHRFPKGKKEIAAAVLTYVEKSIHNTIYAMLTDGTCQPEDRLNKALENISTFYNNGEETCILRALSLDSGMDVFGDEIKASIQKWMDGFITLGMALGDSNDEAKRKAHKTFVLIQGSLVLAKGISSKTPFKNALLEIRAMYIE